MTRAIPEDVNRIAEFLTYEQIPSTLPSTQPATNCIVLCVSAILDVADIVFSQLEQCPTLTQTLVLCGGIGHSTPYLYEAVGRHPRFAHLAEETHGLPEAQVLHRIFTRCFDAPRIQQSGCRVLVEDQSTNCGANAIHTRKLLLQNDIPHPGSMLIVQDPTMARRTIASFERVYESDPTPPRFWSWPIVVPRVRLEGQELVYDIPRIPTDRLWSRERFLGLLLGEIPRLRDDQNGYGPNGKGFIGHVDIPEEVERAWERLRRMEMARR
ncbi:hypothetical protein EYZ11_010706 [Aspergillus tanneri]|uniref:Uncharacterized protein n=1 Tax=Aspergillus tanneri TaxID=1220188 RepID=A0A4S3J6T8_9EURO|nr:uncharacterized protein ATNIH1004_007026 [Aspergillus tanneri]KAA8645607.1 hypothetical protein ATNIH1004_007026 [Aspergillus tanneri]THC89838.1 hypothetical protein EYZ11_010706 [Aspergillus tanneri]